MINRSRVESRAVHPLCFHDDLAIVITYLLYGLEQTRSYEPFKTHDGGKIECFNAGVSAILFPSHTFCIQIGKKNISLKSTDRNYN